MRYWETLTAVERRIAAFPPAIHTDDPRTLLSRIIAAGPVNTDYETAITRAALEVLLAAAIDEAENVRIETGEAA